MTRVLAAAAAVVLIYTALWAQTSYIMLGTHENISYEAELKPRETGKTRNKILSGENKDWSIVTDWSYDCRTKSLKEVHRVIYTPDGKIAQEGDVQGEWRDAQKGSFGRQLLDDYWCKGIS